MQAGSGRGFQLDFNNFDRSVCQILERMSVRRTPYHVAGVVRDLPRLTVGIGAYFAHFGQVYDHTVRVGVHGDFLARGVILANDANLLVVDFNLRGWMGIGWRVLRSRAGVNHEAAN